MHWRRARLLGVAALLTGFALGLPAVGALGFGLQPLPDVPPLERLACDADAPALTGTCARLVASELVEPPPPDVFERAVLTAIALRAAGVDDPAAGDLFVHAAGLATGTPLTAPSRGRGRRGALSSADVQALAALPHSPPDGLVELPDDVRAWVALRRSRLLPADPSDSAGWSDALVRIAAIAAEREQQRVHEDRQRAWTRHDLREAEAHAEALARRDHARTSRALATTAGAIAGGLALFSAGMGPVLWFRHRRPHKAPPWPVALAPVPGRWAWRLPDARTWAEGAVAPPVDRRPWLPGPLGLLGLATGFLIGLAAWIATPLWLLGLLDAGLDRSMLDLGAGTLAAHLIALVVCVISAGRPLDAAPGVDTPALVGFRVDAVELPLAMPSRWRRNALGVGVYSASAAAVALGLIGLCLAAGIAGEIALVLALFVALLVIPPWLLGAAVYVAALEIWDRADQPTWILIGGRALVTSEGEEFALDAPNRRVELRRGRDAAELRLRSDLQDVTVRGPARELAWLQAYLERRGPDGEESDAARVALARLVGEVDDGARASGDAIPRKRRDASPA